MDIQAAIAQRAGVGRYTKSLVEHLAPLTGADELSLFYFDFKRKGIPFPVEGATQRAVHWCPGRYAQYAWKTFGWPSFDFFAGPADVYHFPNFIRPPLRRGKSVVTIHDVSFLRFPETTEARNLKYLKAWIQLTVERSDAIITVSEFVRREICELLKVSPKKVIAIHSGLDPHLARPSIDVTQKMRRRLSLDRPYLLTVGTVEPRKNIGFLIDVFDQLEGFDGDLVIAGMKGWKFEPIFERIRQSPKAARIRHLDFVEEKDLPSLYAGAELFVFPSLYEGFGFTPLEAMACRTPVVASAEGSLPEVLGDAAAIVPKFDADLWAKTIISVLRDSDRRESLLQKGKNQVHQYSWTATARRTWELYRRL
jgi:glycosyltransferase involved in cell wall biosynthesis